jgi:UDP-glucose 4-epimerase
VKDGPLRILVTGGAGYVGSHVVKRVKAAGHRPVVVDNLSAGHRAAVGDVPLVVADFADAETLARLGDEGPFHAVIHMAAHVKVGESVAHPERYYRNNVIRSLQLLEWVRQAGWGGIVFSSTAAVYGEPEDVPIREDHPTLPTNPYGETKLAFERALASYRQAYGLPYVSLRYFNAAGADPDGDIGEDHGCDESHLIPVALTAAQREGTTVSLFGTDYPTSDGTAVRDYVHVSDLAEAHVRALSLLGAGRSGIYNLGNGEGFSVREVISVCSRVAGRSIPIDEIDRRPGDPAVLVASSEKARDELKWSPRFPSLEAIVGTAWQWHRSHPNGYGRAGD